MSSLFYHIVHPWIPWVGLTHCQFHHPETLKLIPLKSPYLARLLHARQSHQSQQVTWTSHHPRPISLQFFTYCRPHITQFHLQATAGLLLSSTTLANRNVQHLCHARNVYDDKLANLCTWFHLAHNLANTQKKNAYCLVRHCVLFDAFVHPICKCRFQNILCGRYLQDLRAKILGRGGSMLKLKSFIRLAFWNLKPSNKAPKVFKKKLGGAMIPKEGGGSLVAKLSKPANSMTTTP